MTDFQALLAEYPEIERGMEELAKERARTGPLSEDEARAALGLRPLNVEKPRKKRKRRFFDFVDAAAL